MQKKMEQYIEQHHMVSAGDKIIVGVSGGADSMCLLCVLQNYQKKVDFQLVAVHVNHMLRGEAADADEAFVEAYCREKQIPYECFHVPVDTLAKEKKLSTEEAGRIARRDAFVRAKEMHGANKIALAHHRNDNAETFLLNLARGSGLDGLCGIRPVNGEYIRPLLCVKREEVERYLEEQGIAYCSDASNSEDIYTRNRVRNHVIPYLETEVNAKCVDHMQSAMEELREIKEYLDMQTQRLEEMYIRQEQEGLLISEAVMKEPQLMQNRILRKGLIRFAQREKDIESKHVEMLRNLLEKQVGRKADLPYGIQALRVYEGIQLQREQAQEDLLQKIEITALKVGETKAFTYGEWEIEVRLFPWDGNKAAVPKKTYTKWFDYDIINGNVNIRGREAGDRIVIDESGRTQKLKNYFINEKIPSAQRANIPLFADNEQIMWIAGHRQSQAYQISEQTKNVLEIKMYGGKEYGRKN